MIRLDLFLPGDSTSARLAKGEFGLPLVREMMQHHQPRRSDESLA